jgi:hypothetical protein
MDSIVSMDYWELLVSMYLDVSGSISLSKYINRLIVPNSCSYHQLPMFHSYQWFKFCFAMFRSYQDFVHPQYLWGILDMNRIEQFKS